MLYTLFKKEIREQLRTSKLLIILAVLFISGLISPLFAKYTPVILGMIPNLPPGLLDSFPTPTVLDSLAQYIKNVSQFGVFLVILLNMGTLAQEKERGTAAMLFAKPVSRTAFVTAKWLASVVIAIAGMIAAATAMAFYTNILFEPLNWQGFIALNLLMILFLIVYISVSIAASSFARNQGTAAAYAFGGLALLLIFSSLPWISEYMPSNLLNWGVSLTMGVSSNPAWWAAGISVVLILLFVTIACFHIEREEI
jgi:ABC-2 type transport system permease protein